MQGYIFDKAQITILIVDDQPYNIKVLEEILKKESYNYLIATNAQETYQILLSTIPDLILLDIMMPGEDGFEICRKVKNNPKTSEIPIIFLTAKVEVDDKVRGFKLGAIDYITKPFQPIEVSARVSTHIALKKSKEFIIKYNMQLEEILEQRTKELIKSEKQAAFGQLIQGIIHNIRGPISSVISSFSLIEFYKEDTNKILSEQPEVYKKLNESLNEIWEVIRHDESQLQKLIKTVDAMMIKSRSDKSEVIELVDLNEIIRQEIEFMRADMFFNKIEKNIKLFEEPLNIKVIPGEIAQVFNNLLKNSLDAMHTSLQPKIEIGTGTNGSHYWFYVADTGQGISESIIDKIFDPFYTTKKMRRDENDDSPTGSGIGLHFCKQTIESYGGRIEVISKPDKGAKFIVYIPLNN
ncbi:MAG: hybrid sensor histidine kinase/response regulator [Bacteroidales bacterium]|nr:hybrid sensor histidine kinase/response regulator [Bacteroidales bacterium]